MGTAKYCTPYAVDSAFIDGALRFTLIGMATMAQSQVSFHFGDNGLSIPHVAQKNRTWVVSKQHFEVSGYPLWRDELVLCSWMEPPSGPFCTYDFQFGYAAQGGRKASLDAPLLREPAVPGSMGQEFFRGTSQWLLLDLGTMRPVRIAGAEFERLACCDERLFPGRFPKIDLPQEFEVSQEFFPGRLEIDLNSHVNNIEYLRYIFSWLPPCVTESPRELLVRTLDTQYVSSAHAAERLACRCARVPGADDGLTLVHSIVRADGSEVFRAKTTWGFAESLSRPVVVREG